MLLLYEIGPINEINCRSETLQHLEFSLLIDANINYTGCNNQNTGLASDDILKWQNI